MSMKRLRFTILKEKFTLHQLAQSGRVPENVFKSTFYSFTRTEEELSIVCPDTVRIDSVKREPGWSCIKIIGPLELNQIGVLASISTCLAQAGISIFSISTFDTDYILVKSHALKRAVKELIDTGCTQVTG